MAGNSVFQYEFGYSSHKGMEKEINEDNYCVEREENKNEEIYGLAALSDGIGGFSLGEIASKIAVNNIEKFFRSGEFNQMFEEAEFLEPERVIQELYTRVNHIIMSFIEKENREVGCTLVSGYFMGEQAYVANVGNSRAYLLRGGAIKRITEEFGAKSPDDKSTTAEEDEDSNKTVSETYVNALGSKIGLKADIQSHAVKEGDIFLFCTDGLYTQLSDEDILNVCLQHPTMKSICDALVEKANLSGGRDNITVVAVKANLKKTSRRPSKGKKTSGQPEKPVSVLNYLIVIALIIGAIFLAIKLIPSPPPATGKTASVTSVIPPASPDTSPAVSNINNSLTLKTDIPVKSVLINTLNRPMSNAEETFVLDKDKNEITITPDLKKKSLYMVTLSGMKRDIEVVQARKNRVVVSPEKIVVDITHGSRLNFQNRSDGASGEIFVLKINNLGSPFTISMESQENISALIEPDLTISTSETNVEQETGGNKAAEGRIKSVPGKVKGEKLDFKLE